VQLYGIPARKEAPHDVLEQGSTSSAMPERAAHRLPHGRTSRPGVARKERYQLLTDATRPAAVPSVGGATSRRGQCMQPRSRRDPHRHLLLALPRRQHHHGRAHAGLRRAPQGPSGAGPGRGPAPVLLQISHNLLRLDLIRTVPDGPRHEPVPRPSLLERSLASTAPAAQSSCTDVRIKL
jgi:hypothetical protein